MLPWIVWGSLQSSGPHSLPNPATLNPSNFHEWQPCEPWTNSGAKQLWSILVLHKCVWIGFGTLGVSKCKFLQNDPKLGLHPEPVNYPTFRYSRYKINLASTAKLMRQLSVTCHHCFHECFQWPPKVPSKYSIGGIRHTGNNTSIQNNQPGTTFLYPWCMCVWFEVFVVGPNTAKTSKKLG